MQKSQILKQYFGYDSFRTGQEELIKSILDAKDVLGIMPTGAGKSLCFQVPALMFEGITLVVSPLVSLMKDQVQALVANGISAAFINSTLSYGQTVKAIENAKDGKYKIIYVAPERLDIPEFLEFAKNADISMVTVDEAHCVSQWGQNFRPSYLKIRGFVDRLPKRPVIAAFTATATGEVKEDIIQILKLDNPFVRITGFNRENLYFEVQKPKDKYQSLLKYLKENPGKSGIVYCSTRKTVEEVCDSLISDNFKATRYHAGLSEGERNKSQEDFLFDRKPLMVATNAFGMGIDKSNVSFVIHYNMPKNVESYYQEAGRAGRDGTPADCILLYSGQDVFTNQYLIENTSENSELDAEILEKVKEKDRERLKQMIWYCHSTDCLRGYILNYFGESTAGGCDNCSNCNNNFEEADITESAQMIFSCIARMKERYGIKMVIDTLRGSKSEKVLKFGLDKIKTYGIMAKVKEKQLRDMINHLVLHDYLFQTNSEFALVKLTEKAKEVMFDGVRIRMKTAREEGEPEKAAKAGKQKVYAVNNELLLKLKDLRLKLAQEKSVPAFVIFSDASLMDMCSKLPANETEFLEVSGVGRRKLEAYGKAFLEVINGTDSGIEAVHTEEPVGTLSEVCKFIAEKIELSEEPIPISMFADKINVLLMEKNYKKIPAQKYADYLLKQGYLELETTNGKNSRIASSKGMDIGISTILKVRSYDSFKQNFYNKPAQAFLVDHIETILSEALDTA